MIKQLKKSKLLREREGTTKNKAQKKKERDELYVFVAKEREKSSYHLPKSI